MKKLMTLIVVGLVGLMAMPAISHAETMNYTVKANIPENQIDKTKTYFDLRMAPGQEQKITLTVSNTANEELDLKIEPNTAITNQNGVIDYSQAKAKKDSSLEYPFSKIVKGETSFKLAPNETREIAYTIKMPTNKAEGTILGGFYISKVNKAKEEEASKNVQIKNYYSYVIGVKLTEEDTPVKPVLKLNKVKPDLQNYHTVVTANLQNIKPTMVADLKVETAVTKKGSSEVLHRTTKESMSMAPNSNFDFPTSWDNKPLEPGKYELKMTATSNGNKWNFTKAFEIKGTQSTKLNDDAVELKKTSKWIYIIIAGLIFDLVILVVLIMWLRRRKGGASNEAQK